MAEITLGEILKKASIRVPILVDKIFKKNNRNNIFELVSNGANFTATAANLDNIIYGPGKENAKWLLPEIGLPLAFTLIITSPLTDPPDCSPSIPSAKTSNSTVSV